MSRVIAAMQAKIGSTEYYALSMKAQELSRSVVFPSKKEREDLPLDAREQRDLNLNRVKKHIAPYMSGNQDRFWGAVILTTKSKVRFEPLSKIAQEGMTELHKTQAEMMGFLTLTGGEVLIPLDGQHRIKALKFAISGKDDHDREIKGLEPDETVADDDVTVILIPSYSVEKARQIFTRVNRYAKQTTPGQNLVTDDDDIVAVIAREVSNDIIGSRLVKYKGNSLTDKDGEFTTLSAVAESVFAILATVYKFKKKDRHANIEHEQMKMYTETVCDIWGFLAKNIEEFSLALGNKKADGDEVRKQRRTHSLLSQPMPQVCLVDAFVRLTNGQDWKMPRKDAAKKLNGVDWEKQSKLWDRAVVSGGGKLLTKPANRALMTDFLCYQAGMPMDEADLLERYISFFPEAEQKTVKLPPKLK